MFILLEQKSILPNVVDDEALGSLALLVDSFVHHLGFEEFHFLAVWIRGIMAEVGIAPLPR